MSLAKMKALKVSRTGLCKFASLGGLHALPCYSRRNEYESVEASPKLKTQT